MNTSALNGLGHLIDNMSGAWNGVKNDRSNTRRNTQSVALFSRNW